MNILNGNEAFTALMAGKNIMCRYSIDSSEWDELGNFPATIFSAPEYEFCIKIDEIHLNGFVFLKPYSIEELVDGQEIFIVENFSRITQCTFNAKDERHVLTAKSGFVQRDRKNAGIQAEAIQSVLGFQCDVMLQKEDGKKSKSKPVQMTVEPLNIIDSTAGESEAVIKVAEAVNSNPVETTTEQAKTDLQVEDISVSESTEDTAARINQTNYESLLKDLISRAQKSKTPAEANALYRYTTLWTEEQRKPLMDAITLRLQELNPLPKSESSLMVRISEASNLIELKKLENEIAECDPQIQERLMSYANQRRTDLVNNTELPWEE